MTKEKMSNKVSELKIKWDETFEYKQVRYTHTSYQAFMDEV